MLLLQALYGLSDESAEERARDHISLSKFCGISMDERLPGSKVYCRFGSALNQRNALEEILNAIQCRNGIRGLLITKSVIVDARLALETS